MTSPFDGRLVRIAAAGALFLILFPFAVILLTSFNQSRYLEFPPPGLSVRWYQELIADPSWASAFQTSIAIALAAATLAVALSLSAALALNLCRIRYRTALLALIITPIFAPVIAYAVGLYFVFAPLGLLDSSLGLVLAHTVLCMPTSFLTLNAALKQRGGTDELAALTLGASYFRTFRSVTLPSLWANLTAAFALAFVISFDEPVLALFIAGTRVTTLPKKMWDGITFELDPAIAASSVLLVVLSVLIVAVAGLASRRPSAPPA